jgi:hypothetical protein
MIQATSLIALEEVLSKINDRQKQVLIAFKSINKPANNLMISRFTGLPINATTPRCLEIKRKGLIIYHHTSACPETGRATRFYVLKDWINQIII